jgi:hypothetical protein
MQFTVPNILKSPFHQKCGRVKSRSIALKAATYCCIEGREISMFGVAELMYDIAIERHPFRR